MASGSCASGATSFTEPRAACGPASLRSVRDGTGRPLASFEWPFGKLFFGRRARCDECGSLVLAMVLCAECGKEYLAGRMVLEDRTLVPRDVGVVEQTDDVPELVDYGSEEEDDDEDDGRGDGLDRYLAHPATPKVPTIHLDRRTGRWVGSDADAALEFGEVLPATSGHPRCPECRTSRRADWLLRPLRGGASLILRNTIPIMLDYTPELADRGSEPLPHAGRRLLTFTDSRQGTARFALTAQIDSERNYTRGAIYHQTAAERTDHAPDPARIAQLKSEIAALEEVKPENAQIQKIIAEKKAGLATLTGPRLGCRAWKDAIEKLSRETEISKWLPDHWRHLPLADLEAHELAEIALLREFARRPKRQTSLETLGFVSVEYPRLAATGSEPPSPWRMRGLDAGEWRNFLKLMLDHLVRGRRCIEVEGAFIPWLGVPHRPSVLIGPDAERFEGAVRWPLAAGPTLRSRFVQLLALILEVDPSESGAARAEIDACLRLAWRQISAVLVTSGPGHRLNFGEGVALREIRDAWLCPITRRVLDTTVMGLTPYVVSGLHRKDLTARPVRMPRLKTPFWRKPMGGTYSRDEIDQAIRDDPDIAELERLGVWRGWSRRIFEHVDYFQVAEHSAQLSAARLRDLEDRFRRGRVNVLSCSTTMEMGVDIGGLSAVAMNNAPPSPANYLQRAGRAGRRGEPRAVGLTLCNTSAHGEHVFRNPLWPFKTPLHVTRVGLHSERIVRRHANALTLTRFFASRFHRQEFHRLSTGWFFEQRDDTSSVCEQFRSWLGDGARSDPWLETGLGRLLRGSTLDGIETDRLLSMVDGRIAAAASAWAAEAEPLHRELDGLAGHASADVVRRAIELQLRRLREEYLLRELAVRNFLPGYGFPTQVVPLVTTTKDDLKWRRRRRTDASGDREDNFSRARQYPTRHLSAALHEYGPGANVILDGRVLTSSGLTLNWKIPATDEAAREVQALRHTWRCRHCGAVGTGIRPREVCESGYCDGRESPLEAHSYIEPAGFAVDIRDSLNNDLSRFSYVPTKPPRISTGGESWQSLAVSALGRFRCSASGQVFHHTAGEYGHGFAICLHCGRAVAEHEKEGELPKRMREHKPLRGGSTAGPDDLCSGNDGTYTIRRNEWLGVSRETDVFELQLRAVLVASATDTDRGTGAEGGVDGVAAASIAIALREALAERIGVEDREIGWAIKEARVEETGEKNVSILLYDHATGGAGFVAQAPEHLPALLHRARETLDCARRCDKACHACLVSYDTHHTVDRLDRHRALDILSDTFLAALDLPAEEQVFGPTPGSSSNRSTSRSAGNFAPPTRCASTWAATAPSGLYPTGRSPATSRAGPRRVAEWSWSSHATWPEFRAESAYSSRSGDERAACTSSAAAFLAQVDRSSRNSPPRVGRSRSPPKPLRRWPLARTGASLEKALTWSGDTPAMPSPRWIRWNRRNWTPLRPAKPTASLSPTISAHRSTPSGRRSGKRSGRPPPPSQSAWTRASRSGRWYTRTATCAPRWWLASSWRSSPNSPRPAAAAHATLDSESSPRPRTSGLPPAGKSRTTGPWPKRRRRRLSTCSTPRRSRPALFSATPSAPRTSANWRSHGTTAPAGIAISTTDSALSARHAPCRTPSTTRPNGRRRRSPPPRSTWTQGARASPTSPALNNA